VSGLGLVLDDLPSEEVERLEALHVPLAEAIRELVSAAILTTVDDATVRSATETVRELTAELRREQAGGTAGVHHNPEGRAWNWGNAAVGLRNAAAPPLVMEHRPDGTAYGEATLGPAHEGPPGLAHGGIVALLLDHIMGVTASRYERVTFTGTLTVRFLRGTPLGPVRVDARIDSAEGRKVVVVGSLSDEDGITAEAEGTFVVPRWAL
jgi:acyl-coenzyme A thioesterase PaaI-like protein